MKLTQERVRELFDYREDGELIWKVRNSNRIKVGDIAGHLGNGGYRRVMLHRKLFLSHRLIWLWWYGYLPEHDIDHINRNRLDNRINNLREVSRQCNLRNCVVSKRNSSGIIGVCWDRDRKKWQAKIEVAGVVNFLGRFDTLTGAAIARWEAEVEHKWPSCNSTSSAYLYLKEAGEI